MDRKHELPEIPVLGAHYADNLVYLLSHLIFYLILFVILSHLVLSYTLSYLILSDPIGLS